MRALARILGVAGLAVAPMAAQVPGARAQSSATVEQLLTDGWEIAGYVAAWENRSLILFKHKDRKYLVQCSILIDVLRNPRQVIYCYEIK
jgi:hypothetical protein